MTRRYLSDLDAETVRRLKKARDEGLSFSELATRFGFSKNTVTRVLKGASGGAR